MPDPTETIAANLRTLRKERQWSAQGLSDRLLAAGVPIERSVIANLENGRRAAVSVHELLALADVFGVVPSFLLPGLDAPHEKCPNFCANCGVKLKGGDGGRADA